MILPLCPTKVYPCHEFSDLRCHGVDPVLRNGPNWMGAPRDLSAIRTDDCDLSGEPNVADVARSGWQKWMKHFGNVGLRTL